MNKHKPPRAFTEEETVKICMNCKVADDCRVYKLAVNLSKKSGGDLTISFGCTEFSDEDN